MNSDNKISLIKKAYQKNQLDLNKAVNVWLDNDLSEEDMTSIVQADTGHSITKNELGLLIKSALFRNVNVETHKHLAALEQLNTNKVVPLTVEVKKLIKSAGPNTWKQRFGSSGIEWSIIFIDNKPHLARKQNKENEQKFSNEEFNPKA